MNILPKKRWHVRTKDNIARVRRDEAEAAEKERIRLEKQEYAENEARLNLLRSKAGGTATSTISEADHQATITSSDGHVDLFSDFKTHIKTTNKEHEKEKKEEKEKYEKQIGYLTYLGQDTNEALNVRSWYEIAPNRAEVDESNKVERDLKAKYYNDPLTLIKALLPEEKIVKKAKTTPAVATTIAITPPREEIVEVKRSSKKTKKEKKHKKEKRKKKKKRKETSSDDEEKQAQELARKKELINRLRKERLKREARERARAEELLCPKVEKPVAEVQAPPRIVQKYNSQFNPELAKQNMV